MAEPAELIETRPRAGAVLKQLRDKRNISIQEVASQLRLDPQIIEALEQDNYEKFAADTYIRGYLRSYAKLIGVNGDEIISLYASEAPEPPEIIPDVKHPTQVSSSDKPVKAFTYLVTFILVLLLLIWWWQSSFTFNDIKMSAAPRPVPPIVETPIETITTVSDLPQEILDAIPDPVAQEVMDLPPDLNPQPADIIGTVDGEAAAAGPIMEEGVVLSDFAEGLEQPEDDENKADPGPDTVYLKLNADCWVEVFDRYNKEVYLNLARNGEEIFLNGNAPFEVKLGNAQSVILEFNNIPFDPAPYTSRGIARFTLGD